MRTKLLGAATLVAATWMMPANAATVFTDPTFDSAIPYTFSPLFNNNVAQTSLQTVLTSPGSGAQFVGQFNMATPPSGSIYNILELGIFNPSFAYDPTTQGAITDLSASVSKNLAVNQPSGPTPFGNTFHPTIQQGGVYYVASIPGPPLLLDQGVGGETGFNTIAGGLTAADFTEFNFADGSSDGTHPNFSGGPMLFGLTQVFSADAPSVNETATATYEDLVVSINLPEPQSLAVLGIGLTGLWLVRRRKTQTD
jgi:hypothetical protein